MVEQRMKGSVRTIILLLPSRWAGVTSSRRIRCVEVKRLRVTSIFFGEIGVVSRVSF